MESLQILNQLRVELIELKSQGVKTLDLEALESYIENLNKGTEFSIELQKMNHQSSLAHYDAQIKNNIALFKSVIDSGREAINALVLINGGAVVSLLGFMGATISKGLSSSLGANLTTPLLYFGLGVLAGAFAFGGRYCAQWFYSSDFMKIGHSFLFVTVFVVIAGYMLFGFGICEAYSAFSKQFQ